MEVMLDLETLSTRNCAAILVIAGIKFNLNSDSVPLDKVDKKNTFYRRIDADSCKEIDLHVDEKTVAWWKTQDEKIQEEAFGKERIPLKQALQEFSSWYGNSSKIWSQGANFDIPILDEAYQRCGMSSPWKFWSVRDTRTVYDLAGLSARDFPQDNLHHALHDCQRQIDALKKSMRRIRSKE